MIDYIATQIEMLMRTARDDYGVDPVIFLVLYFGTAPLFYYSLFRMARALKTRRGNEITLWSLLFLVATAAPFVYVLLFGRNLPWWAYVVIALLIGQGLFTLIRALRRKPVNGA